MNPHAPSLEHSYTNIFALTDFNGIQYKVFTYKSDDCYNCVNDDPLLKSYLACQESGLLCAWNRKQKRNVDEFRKPHILKCFSKSLYVFWYGSEDLPDEASKIDDRLIVQDSGNWSLSLSYDIRILLFKSLHNLIEKKLLAKRFLRVHKWFVQPSRYEGENHDCHIGFRFNFFLHGESTVCSIIDFQSLPTLYVLSSKHLDYCKTHKMRIPVILCPYGLSAELISPSVKEMTQEEAEEEINSWSRFYPLKNFFQPPEDPNQSFNASTTPNKMKNLLNTSQTIEFNKPNQNFVDVLVGGYRMRYPSSLVLVSGDDIDPKIFDPMNISQVNSKATPSTANEHSMNDPYDSSSIKHLSPAILKSPTIQQKVKLYGLNYLLNRNCKNSRASDLSLSKTSDRHLSQARITIIDGPHLYSLFRKNYHLSSRFMPAPHESKRCYLADFYSKRAMLSSSIYPLKDNKKRWRYASPSCSTQCTCSEEPLSCPFLTLKKSINKKNSFYHNRSSIGSLSGESLSMLFSKLDESTGQKFINQIRKEYSESLSHLPGTQDLTPIVCGNGRDPIMPTLSPQQPTHLKDGHQKVSTSSVSPSVLPPSPKKQKFNLESQVKKEVEEEIPPQPQPKRLPSGIVKRKEENKTVTGLVIGSIATSTYASTPILGPREPSFSKSSWLISSTQAYPKIDPSSDVKQLWNLQPSVLDFYELQEYHENIYEPNLVRDDSSKDDNAARKIKSESEVPLYSPVSENETFGFYYDDAMQYDWSFIEPHMVFEGIRNKRRNSLIRSRPPLPSLSSYIFDHRQFNGERNSLIPTKTPVVLSQLKRDQSQENKQNIKPIKADPSPDYKLSEKTNSDFIVISRGNEFASQFSSDYVQKIIERVNRQANENAILIKAIESIISEVHPNQLDNDLINQILPANGLLFNILLQDSQVDLFMDHNFDSCNICECTGSVWSKREIGLYLPEPNRKILSNWSDLQIKISESKSDEIKETMTYERLYDKALGICKCGFSATSNRKAVSSGNLFFEDEIEVMSTNHIDMIGSDPEIKPLIKASLINQLVTSNVSLKDDLNGEESLKWIHTYTHPYLNIPLYINYFDSMNKDMGDTLAHYQSEMAKVDLLSTLFHHVRNASFLNCYPLGNLLSDYLVATWTFERFGCTKVIKDNIFEFKETSALYIAALKQSGPSSSDDDLRMSKLQPSAQHDASRQKNTVMCDDISLKNGIFVHPGFVLKRYAKPLTSFTDQLLLLDTIKPMLQEAITSTRSLEASYTVDGPLTWKEFHQLAGRGNEECSKPQPIPQFRVEVESSFSGNSFNPQFLKNLQSILVSPFALKTWNNLSLCPVSKKKKIAYIVLYPVEVDEVIEVLNSPKKNTGSFEAFSDENYVLENIKKYFSCLSSSYQACHLGSHQPFSASHVRKGCIPVSCQEKQAANCFITNIFDNGQLLDSTLRQLESNTVDMNAYVNFIKTFLANASMACVETLMAHGVVGANGKLSDDFPTKKHENKESSQNNYMSKRYETTLKSSSKSPRNGIGSTSTSIDNSIWGTDRDIYLMIYLVEPFTTMFDQSPKYINILLKSLVNGFINKVTSLLPVMWRYRLNFQVVSLGSIIEPISNVHLLNRYTSLALSIYNQVDRLIKPSLVNSNRTLTGFGPASDREDVSIEIEPHHMRRVFSPAYVIQRYDDYACQLENHPYETLFVPHTLFVSYCLSHNQKYLLATCVNETGCLYHETCIDLSLPSIFSKFFYNSYQNSAKEIIQFSLRRWALGKLWEFIVNIVSSTSSPWRLVIGRLGRLGHGELKGWNGLLSNTSLQEVNDQIRKRCSLCVTASKCSGHSETACEKEKHTKSNSFKLYPSSHMNSCSHELPSIVSGCLVSLDSEKSFKVYSNRHGLLLNSHTKRGISSSILQAQGTGPSMISSSTGTSTGSFFSGNYNANSLNQNTLANQASQSSSLPISLNLQSIPMNIPSSEEGPSSIASVTHVLVFPTSTSAAAQTDNDNPEDDIGNLFTDLGAALEDNILILDNELNFDVTTEKTNPATNKPLNNSRSSEDNSMLNKNKEANASSIKQSYFHDNPAFQKSLEPHQTYTDFDGPTGFVYGSRIDLNRLPISRCLNDETLKKTIDEFDKMTQNCENPQELLSKFLTDISSRIFSRNWSILDQAEDLQNSESNIMQQPIAMGYYVSTASASQLPDWFWGESEQSLSEDSSTPVCLKSSLHLKSSLAVIPDEHANNGSANFGHDPSLGSKSSPASAVHPLDSSVTCDVLRYVLESFNSLSWLTYDPTINDRASCLPINMFHLARIYNIVKEFS